MGARFCPLRQFFDASGNPLTAGTVYAYRATTTTAKKMYPTKDDALADTNGATTLTISADGSVPSIWFVDDYNLKLVIKDSSGVIVSNGTLDNIPGEFFSNPILSGNLSLVNGNLILNSSYGVVSSAGPSMLKFVDVASAVNYFQTTNAASAAGPVLAAVGTDSNINFNLNAKGTGKIVLGAGIDEKAGGTLASATTTDIGAVSGNYIQISGTTTITSFGTPSQAGVRKVLEFLGILTITYNVSTLRTLTGANIITAANDRATFIYDGTGWVMIDYNRATGGLVLPATAAEVLAGTVTDRAITPATSSSVRGVSHGYLVFTAAGAVSYGYNVASISKTGTGAYSITYSVSVSNPVDTVLIIGAGGACYAVVTAITATVLSIQCYNLSAVATDPASSIATARFGNQ